MKTLMHSDDKMSVRYCVQLFLEHKKLLVRLNLQAGIN